MKYRAKKRERKAFSAELKIAIDIDTSGDGVNIHPEMLFCMHSHLEKIAPTPVLLDTGTAVRCTGVRQVPPKVDGSI
ncbi:hypothetical protein EMCRGX_G002434 [Ephydatia muelleri]